MTSHTETTSKVTETINSIDYSTGWQYSVTGTNVSNNGQSLNPPTATSTVTVNPLGGVEGQVTSANTGLDFSNSSFTIANPGEAFQFTQTYQGPERNKSNCNPESHRGYKRNGHYKYLYPVILSAASILTPLQVLAADVGGVSATANPIANSSGAL